MRGSVGTKTFVILIASLLLSIGVYLPRSGDALRGTDPNSTPSWDVASGGVLNDEAHHRLQLAVERLNSSHGPPSSRLAEYRTELARAERLLTRSLRAQPAQAMTLARLAAVRYELEPPLSGEERARFRTMIETASTMAPRVPAVQTQLGELLFRMGREREAWRYLSRAVELDPGSAGSVVKLPLESLLPPETIRRSLPAIPEVLVALHATYVGRGEESLLLDAGDPLLPRATPRFLAVYGDAALRARDPDRLLRAVETVGPRDDPALEAERLLQRSRARFSRGEAEEALEDARAAAMLLPRAASYAEHLGSLALAAKRPEVALEAYARALALVSRDDPSPAARARLYRQIGQAEEAAGRPPRAFDAYRRAVETDPSEGFAARRLAEMEKAAGVGTPLR